MTGPAAARIGAQVQVQRLRAAELRARRESTAVSAPLYHEVDTLLEAAEKAAECIDGRWSIGRQSWLALERAWFSLHAADEILVALEPSDMVRARIPDILARAAETLPSNDPRVTEVHAIARGHGAGTPARTPLGDEEKNALAVLLRAVNASSDASFGRARSFRHIIVVATTLLCLAATVLLVAGALAPHLLPLCTQPPRNSGRTIACPSGGGAASGGDVLVVGLMGVLGAGFSAIAAIATLGPLLDPFYAFSTPVVQGLLKLPIGAMAAIVGVLAVEDGLDAGAGIPTTQGGVLFLAFALGYSQQLLTRIVDRRGADVRGSLSCDLGPGATLESTTR